jgi:hypothetical protein
MDEMDIRKLASRLCSESGQVWNYALWIALVSLFIGIIITQIGPVAWNHISIRGTANDAVDEAVITYQTSRGNMEKVNTVVRNLLNSRDTRLEGTINVTRGSMGEPDMISISVRKIVNTFLFENVGYLCRFTEARAYSERPIP